MLFVLFILQLAVLFILSINLTKSMSSLLYRITKSQSATTGILSALFLPGVIIHELSHLLTASILFVPVGEIEFVPKIEEGRVRLGSVEVGKTDPIRRAIIGFSPVLVGSSILLISLFLFTNYSSKDPILYLVLFFIVFEIGNTMFSSKKDIEGTLELLAAGGIVLLVLFILGFRIPQDFISFFNRPDVLENLKTANILILAPILIDILIIGLVQGLGNLRKI